MAQADSSREIVHGTLSQPNPQRVKETVESILGINPQQLVPVEGAILSCFCKCYLSILTVYMPALAQERWLTPAPRGLVAKLMPAAIQCSKALALRPSLTNTGAHQG